MNPRSERYGNATKQNARRYDVSHVMISCSYYSWILDLFYLSAQRRHCGLWVEVKPSHARGDSEEGKPKPLNPS